MEQVITNPDPYAPILLSQGIKVGNLAFISGQAGYGDDGEIVKGGFDAQVCHNHACICIHQLSSTESPLECHAVRAC